MSDKAWHVYKHLESSWTCRDSCSAESFHDSRFCHFQVKTKEVLYIKWEIPSLNQQRHLDLCLFLNSFSVFLYFWFILFNLLLLYSFSTTVGMRAVICSQCIPIIKLLT